MEVLWNLSKRPLARIAIAASVIFASCLASASDGSRHAGCTAGPSSLDYMVMASIADTRLPLAMTGYGFRAYEPDRKARL
jgi:hypothetical protein